MATRLGVDVGGTFTDLVYYDDESGQVLVGKKPTTPRNPEEGVLSAVRASVPFEGLSAARYFLHGTTVGLNSLLTRTGAVVGMLVTRGFRDVLDMGRGDRAEPFNLFWSRPAPLVPRRLRLPVSERIRADGEVHVALEGDDVLTALEVFYREGATSIAIAFINSYANPAHELAARRILCEAGFDGAISLSHEVSGEYREYERTSTTVVDAYVRPRMASYLHALEEKLGAAGFGGSCLVTRSGGGAMTFVEAEARPFETIMSGPVAGAEGAGELARLLGLTDVITADVGGTSFDTCLITGGRPHLMYQGSVVGLPVQTPWVDVRSIGAGGGSIARVDVGGLLRVGPESAGAEPGPACYGQGGLDATVTDAALALGMLGEGLLANRVRLDLELAHSALRPLADDLRLTMDQVAKGILTIATASMADAIREITVEQGQDPRKATLMAFGGAGPLFATLLARELEIGSIVIPPYAGNFSAWGLLGADLTQTAAQTRLTRLGPDAPEQANAVVDQLFRFVDERAVGGHEDGSQTTRAIGLDMRYVGQEHTLTVQVPAFDRQLGLTAKEIGDRFTHEYARTFGHTIDQGEVEIVSYRATVRTPLPRRAETSSHEKSVNLPDTTFQAYSFTQGSLVAFRLFERSALVQDVRLIGPAIVREETATTYLDAGFAATVGRAGSLFITAMDAG